MAAFLEGRDANAVMCQTVVVGLCEIGVWQDRWGGVWCHPSVFMSFSFAGHPLCVNMVKLARGE